MKSRINHGFLVAVLISIITWMTGCTENIKSKNFGGQMTVSLPKGEKLVTVTWKDDNLWYLTRQTKEGERPETFTFTEKSTFGLMQGKVVFQEN